MSKLTNEELTIEQTLQRLEEIVAAMDGPDLTLDASIKLFEEGVRLADSLKKRLEESELKVKQVLETSDGFQTIDFDSA